MLNIPILHLHNLLCMSSLQRTQPILPSLCFWMMGISLLLVDDNTEYDVKLVMLGYQVLVAKSPDWYIPYTYHVYASNTTPESPLTSMRLSNSPPILPTPTTQGIPNSLHTMAAWQVVPPLLVTTATAFFMVGR